MRLTESILNKLNEGVSWDYYDKFHQLNEKYLPESGEGDTLATQAVTAINKLVYKWYNDGDVYDNSNPSGLTGWGNDLSSYANWLYRNVDGAKYILEGINNIGYNSEDEYEELLKNLADLVYSDLENLNKQPKDGSIYKCDGPFSWDESRNYDEEEE